MKKIFNFSLAFFMTAVLLTGCGKSENKVEKEQNLTLSASEIIDKVYEGITDEMPMLGSIEITDENMSYYIGVDNLDIEEGVASEPLIGSIAYSVVVVKVKDGVDVEKAKKDIKEKVDPIKWTCVDAEQVIVESKGNTIILIMMDELNENLGNQIQENFKNLK